MSGANAKPVKAYRAKNLVHFPGKKKAAAPAAADAGENKPTRPELVAIIKAEDLDVKVAGKNEDIAAAIEVARAAKAEAIAAADAANDGKE